MELMRHVAKISNTDQRCVVAFMQIPNRPDHALVIPTDNMPPRFEQAVMDVLVSQEGQNEESLAIALSRRLMADTGRDIFATLHEAKMLLAVPVTSILMMPRPNQPVRLVDILEQLGRLPSGSSQAAASQADKFNPHLNNQMAGDAEQRRNVARNLLIQAELLESDAREKREMAYRNDPSLRRPISNPNEVTELKQPIDKAPLNTEPV